MAIRTILIDEGELSEEGKVLWQNIDSYDKLSRGKTLLKTKPKMKPIELNMYEVELLYVKREIEKMIYNSERVIRDCQLILTKIQDREEYMKSDAKIAMYVHRNLIKRLKRVLDGETAFEEDFELPTTT